MTLIWVGESPPPREGSQTKIPKPGIDPHGPGMAPSPGPFGPTAVSFRRYPEYVPLPQGSGLRAESPLLVARLPPSWEVVTLRNFAQLTEAFMSIFASILSWEAVRRSWLTEVAPPPRRSNPNRQVTPPK